MPLVYLWGGWQNTCVPSDTYWTKSTPRAQTSTAPSFNSVKQPIKVWSSVACCSLCPYPQNVMNIHPSIISWYCKQTRTHSIENLVQYPGGYTDHPPNVPDCSLCHSRPVPNISWKSTDPFSRNVANRHTASWKFRDNSFMRFSIILQTKTDPGKLKIDTEFKGLTAASWKSSR